MPHNFTYGPLKVYKDNHPPHSELGNLLIRNHGSLFSDGPIPKHSCTIFAILKAAHSIHLANVVLIKTTQSANVDQIRRWLIGGINIAPPLMKGYAADSLVKLSAISSG